MILITALLSLGLAHFAAANDSTGGSPVERLRATWAEAPQSRPHDFAATNLLRVNGRLNEHLSRVNHLVGRRPHSVHVISGYSGADYADQNLFRARFRALVREAQRETKARLGANAVTVFAMGGTVDGIGAGYKIIEEMRRGGELSDVVVTGMVANQAVGYHLDGIKDGYDVIAPEQDALLVFETFPDATGSKSWEMKETSDGESQTIQFMLRGLPAPAYSVLHLIEGGEIAFKEALELLIEARRYAAPTKLELRLYVGHREGKLKKMKGFKAATQMARALAILPALKPTNVNVTMRLEAEDKVYADARDFLRAHAALRLGADPDALLSPSQKTVIPPEEALARRSAFAVAAEQTFRRAWQQINDGQLRIDRRVREISRILNDPGHPVQNSSEGMKGAYDDVRLSRELIKSLAELKRSVERARAITARPCGSQLDRAD